MTTSINASLTTKQDALTNYSETIGTAKTIIQTLDDSNTSKSHQAITMPVYHTFLGLGSGTAFMTVQPKAGTCSEAAFSINDSTAWAQV